MTARWYDMDHNPISVEQAEELLGSKDLRVARDTFEDGTLVSTVFLVLDHGWRPDDAPVLYETIVRTPEGEVVTVERYFTREQAIAGHDQIASAARDGVTS